MIATIAVIAATAKKKKKLQRSQRSYETTLQVLQQSQRQQSLRYKKFYLSNRCRCDRWRVVSICSLNFFFSANTAITAMVAIIWKPGLIYLNNHPPFLLNCYLYALQTYRTHSFKLRLLLVFMMIKVINNDELISQIQASNADKIKPCLFRSSEGKQGNRSRGGEIYYYGGKNGTVYEKYRDLFPQVLMPLMVPLG